MAASLCQAVVELAVEPLGGTDEERLLAALDVLARRRDRPHPAG